MTCDDCKESSMRLRCMEGRWVCYSCLPKYERVRQTDGSFKFIQKVYLKGYGMESVARIKEMERRVILPYNRQEENADYYVGRRGENGKIQEREPTY